MPFIPSLNGCQRQVAIEAHAAPGEESEYESELPSLSRSPESDIFSEPHTWCAENGRLMGGGRGEEGLNSPRDAAS